MKELVKRGIENGKKENKGMQVFEVLGNDEVYQVTSELDKLNAKYHVSKASDDGDLKPYDITVDLSSIK